MVVPVAVLQVAVLQVEVQHAVRARIDLDRLVRDDHLTLDLAEDHLFGPRLVEDGALAARIDTALDLPTHVSDLLGTLTTPTTRELDLLRVRHDGFPRYSAVCIYGATSAHTEMRDSKHQNRSVVNNSRLQRFCFSFIIHTIHR